MSKFKVGDKVTGTKDYQIMYGEVAIITKIENTDFGNRYYLKGFGKTEWSEEELKLFEEAKTEFSFEEVIARIKEGEVYQNESSSISKVDGCINVTVFNDNGFTISKDENFTLIFESGRYKLVPQKKEYQLYEVEHQENGKRYLFRSDLDHTLDDMVVCETKFGKSYGKMVKALYKKLTEEEYKAYKPIVKIISKGCPF